MDAGTRAFYERYAATLDAQGEAALSAMSRRFAAADVAGARVLDVGCGSGRDVAVLLAMGADAYAVEPNAAMRERALQNHPQLAGRVADAALPRLGRPFGGEFDVVVCSAVLMHLTPAQLPQALQALADVLVPGGRLLVAVPALDAARLRDGRDREDRLFTSHAPRTLVALLAEHGIAPVDRSALTVDETHWTTLLLQRSTG